MGGNWQTPMYTPPNEATAIFHLLRIYIHTRSTFTCTPNILSKFIEKTSGEFNKKNSSEFVRLLNRYFIVIEKCSWQPIFYGINTRPKLIIVSCQPPGMFHRVTCPLIIKPLTLLNRTYLCG